MMCASYNVVDILCMHVIASVQYNYKVLSSSIVYSIIHCMHGCMPKPQAVRVRTLSSLFAPSMNIIIRFTLHVLSCNHAYMSCCHSLS